MGGAPMWLVKPVWGTPVTSGLVMWFDGQDLNGDGTVDAPQTLGTQVTSWASRVGTTVATASTVGRNPTIANFGVTQVVQFDGNDFMSIANSPASHQTAFFVYSDTSTAQWTTPVGSFLGNRGSYHGNNTDGALFNNTWTDPLTLNGASYRLGGAPINKLATPRPDTMTIDAHVPTGAMTRPLTVLGMDNCTTCEGGVRGINGQIAEVLIYDRALSKSELNSVGGYLASRWGLTWNAIGDPYTSQASGNWSTTGTWNPTPPTGGPANGDTVTIAGHNVTYDAAASGTIGSIAVTGSPTFTLQRDLNVTGNFGRGGAGSTVINLGANTLTVGGTLQPASSSHAQAFVRSPGSKVIAATLVWERNVPLNFWADDSVGNLVVSGFGAAGGSVNTTGSANITNSISMTPGVLLTLGANLNLSGNLAMRESTINDKGFSVTIGGEISNDTAANGNSGIVIREGGVWNVGAVRWGRSGTPELRPGDVVQNSISTYSIFNNNADVRVFQDPNPSFAYDVTEGLTLNNSAANALALTTATPNGTRSELFLEFDDLTTGGDYLDDPTNIAIDWAFRWLGDHETALRNLYTNLQLVVDTGAAPVTFDPLTNIFYSDPALGGDGYTYVGFVSALVVIPEPSNIALWGIAAFTFTVMFVCRRRRRHG
jgi:hypothetical protein